MRSEVRCLSFVVSCNCLLFLVCFVFGCSLCKVRCFGVGCWLFVVGCWLLFVGCCLLFDVCCPSFVRCSFCVGCCWLVVGCRVLFVVVAWLLVVG